MASVKVLLLILSVTITSVLGQCGPLPSSPAPAHATPASILATSPVGTLVEYTCDSGYEFDIADGTSTFTTECQTDDTWEPVPDCAEVNCPVLPFDAADLSSQANQYLDVVTITCANSSFYRIPGVDVGMSLTVTCQANKTWDLWEGSSLLGCIPIQCVQSIANHSIDNNQATARGSIVDFTCDTGYFFNDDLSLPNITVTCNSNAEWEDSNGVTDWECVPQICADIEVEHGLNNVVVTPDTRFVGEKIKIACKDGHEYNDSSIEKFSVCQGNKTWDFVPFDCQAKLCPPVANISRANISTLDNWYPTVVNFTCDPGFFFPDGSLWRISTCNKYGKWSVSVPNCGDVLAIETNFVESTYDVDGAASYSILFGVIVLGGIIAMFVLDVITFPRQSGVLKANLRSRFECLRPPEEDLESLDGDEVMRASTISLGRGRITPAASTVDLQYGEKSKQSQLNTLEDVEVINEELQTTEIAGKKNLIPRTRLASAKSSILKAVTKASGVEKYKGKMMTTIRKNEFSSTGLPLGAQNYGKIVEMRPPSPTKEDEESEESDYTDDESDEEDAV